MANVLNVSPMVVDTAAILVPADKEVKLQAISWVSVDGTLLVADNDIVLSDGTGNVLVKKRATVDGDGLEMWHFAENFRCTGLTMTTIDGGVAYVYAV